MKNNKLHLLKVMPVHPTDQEYLDLIFYGHSKSKFKNCPNCKCKQKFYHVNGRKCYECGKCGLQVYPLKNTFLEGTKLPLWKWFDIIKEFGVSKNGISSLEIKRRVGVTKKVAWRMGDTIRDAMLTSQLAKVLKGVVQIDEALIGGKRRKNAKGKVIDNKKTVFGMVEENGSIFLVHVENRNKKTLYPLIRAYIGKGSTIYSDEHGVYTDLKKEGYVHSTVPHNQFKFKVDDTTTNTIEGAWSQIKRMIKGTFISTGKSTLQNYLGEFSFRYDRRHRVTKDDDKVEKDLLEMIYSSSIARLYDIDEEEISEPINL